MDGVLSDNVVYTCSKIQKFSTQTAKITTWQHLQLNLRLELSPKDQVRAWGRWVKAVMAAPAHFFFSPIICPSQQLKLDSTFATKEDREGGDEQVCRQKLQCLVWHCITLKHLYALQVATWQL